MPLRTSPEKQELKKNIARADRIYCRYGDFIYAVIRSNVRDRALAEDIYQDFFLYLTARPLPEKLDSERAFIYKMLLDRIKDAFRTSGRYRARLDRYAAAYRVARSGLMTMIHDQGSISRERESERVREETKAPPRRLYKWTDPEGRVHITDRPPPQPSTKDSP